MSDPADTVTVPDLDGLALLLPSTVHTLRRVVDAALLTADCSPVVVGEVESPLTLGRAVRGGLGATILPASVAASCSPTPSDTTSSRSAARAA